MIETTSCQESSERLARISSATYADYDKELERLYAEYMFPRDVLTGGMIFVVGCIMGFLAHMLMGG